MRSLLVLVLAASCGNDRGFDTPPEGALLPARARLLTDRQYAHAVHDLLGDLAVPSPHSPGTARSQFLDEDVLAIDAPRLVQYRITAEAAGATVAADPGRVGCAVRDEACLRGRADQLAARAFRRPLEPGEQAQLAALFTQGAATGDPAAGLGLVLEAVLQAPSFVYRTELGAAAPGPGEVELTPYELAAELGLFLLDSIPDEPLWQAAVDGSLADPAVVAAQVERLLALPRVRDHLVEVVLDWLEVPSVLTIGKDAARFPELTPELRASMYEETRRFVADVLWRRGGSLRELLTSRETFVDGQLAGLYGVPRITRATHVPVTLDARRRAGILTQASTLSILATEQGESIVRRGMYVRSKFLCAPDPGRPPFAAIAMAASATRELSEAEFSQFRALDPYCSGCHASIDPAGRALHHYDGLGRWRDLDSKDAPIDDVVELVLDGQKRRLRGARELAAALADSDQVARCVIDQLLHFAFGRAVEDPAMRYYLHESFARNDDDLVQVFRAIAVAPAFRLRRGAP